MAKVPKNIAEASRCAAKLASGKPCTMAEMKATIRLLNQGMNASRVAARTAKKAAKESKEMVSKLLSRL